MGIKFKTQKDRDALTNRLANLAIYMRSSMDQGHNWTIRVDEDMIGDIQTAACVVGLADTEDQ